MYQASNLHGTTKLPLPFKKNPKIKLTLIQRRKMENASPDRKVNLSEYKVGIDKQWH
jgi:hypothetical protein